jgi:hypothetical protein
MSQFHMTEKVVFVFLSFAYLAQHDDLLLHSSLWLILLRCVCVHNMFSTRSSVVGPLSWFHSMAVVNSVAINMGVQVPLMYVDLYCRYMPKSAMAES